MFSLSTLAWLLVSSSLVHTWELVWLNFMSVVLDITRDTFWYQTPWSLDLTIFLSRLPQWSLNNFSKMLSEIWREIYRYRFLTKHSEFIYSLNFDHLWIFVMFIHLLLLIFVNNWNFPLKFIISTLG